MITQDKLWKGLVEDFFMSFLELFHPKFVSQVDTSIPFEFLDNPDSYRDQGTFSCIGKSG